MQTINPVISREKFQHEVAQFIGLTDSYRRRGIVLLKSDFPEIVISFSAVKLKPAVHCFAVLLNFENYDIEPISVRFVDPFTFELLPTPPTPLFRKNIKADGSVDQPLALTQQDNTGLPFVCIPGIREYHNHPAHSGDAWLLHRNVGGEGTLGFIVEALYRYGILAIESFQVQAMVNLVVPNMGIGFNPNLMEA